MTLEAFLDSKLFVFVAAFFVGMLVERWHIYRAVEKYRRMKQRTREVIVQLAQVHGWMQTVGTPQPVRDKVESAAVALNTINEEL